MLSSEAEASAAFPLHGAARSSEVQRARAEQEGLARVREELRQAGDIYWAAAVHSTCLAASASKALASGDAEEALRLALEGADLKDTFEKYPVPPACSALRSGH